MASVYTTARGKNKKNKAKDQGKDARNNKATKLKSDIAKALAPVVDEFDPTRKAFGAMESIGSSAFRTKKAREQLMMRLAEKSCSSPLCPRAATKHTDATGGAGEPCAAPVPPVLRKCACHLVAYCGAECQRAHWEEHKDVCVAKRKEMAEIAAIEAKREADSA